MTDQELEARQRYDEQAPRAMKVGRQLADLGRGLGLHQSVSIVVDVETYGTVGLFWNPDRPRDERIQVWPDGEEKPFTLFGDQLEINSRAELRALCLPHIPKLFDAAKVRRDRVSVLLEHAVTGAVEYLVSQVHPDPRPEDIERRGSVDPLG